MGNWYIGKMVGGNSALLLLVKENKDLCTLLEQHVKVDLIINLSFLKCLKEAPKNASKENYGLCIASSTIDLSFCKELDKIDYNLKKYLESLENSYSETDKKECNQYLKNILEVSWDELNEYIDFIERL